PGLGDLNGRFSNPSTLDAYSVRVDHLVSAGLNLFGRYNYSPSSLNQRGAGFSTGAVLSSTNSLSSSVHTLTIGATHLIGPRTSNEMRANYSSHRVGLSYAMDDF